METDSELRAEISRRLAATKNMHYHYQEYLAIGEDICASLPFKNYFTIKYGFWPKNVDEDSFKRKEKKSNKGEDKEQVEEHAPSLVENEHIEEDLAAAEDTSVSDGFDTDCEGVLAFNDDTELSDGSKKRELDRHREDLLAMKEEIRGLKDTIIQHITQLEFLEVECTESAANLDSISERLEVVKGKQKKDVLACQNIPLQEYIDRACGTMSSQWYSGELVRYEDEGVISSRLCLQDQQQFCFGSSRLVSAAAGAGVGRLHQHVGLFYRYTWDPGITWLDSGIIGSTGRLHEAPRAGVLQSSMGCS